jgi:hypothetical protein
LIARKHELESQLREENTDLQRKRLLTQQLLILDRDIAAIGFDEADVERNSFNYDCIDVG